MTIFSAQQRCGPISFILFPLLLLTGSYISPSLKHFWWNGAFILSVGIPVLIFDRVTYCNYFVLLVPPPGTPLEKLFSLSGSGLYIAALFRAS